MVQSAAAPVPLPGVPKGIDLDGKIVVHKTEAPAGGSSKNALDKVGQAVADIHNRLSKNRELRTGVPIDNKGPDAGAFHATLEINDFPRKSSFILTILNHLLRPRQKRLAGQSPIVLTSPKFWKPRGHPSLQRGASTLQERNLKLAKTQSYTFSWRAIRRLSSQMLCGNS